MGKRMPVRGQAAKWCVCGEWFASERDEREHVGKCPGPREVPSHLRMTAREAIDAIFAAKRRRLPADAFIPAHPTSPTQE